MNLQRGPPPLPRPIELAHCPPLFIGTLEVRPATREVIGEHLREVIEPRVMQVLVALAEAPGEILSRSDLTDRCWEGRIVGEDAINRVLSRLRALARTTGGFRIETINKVGYRLLVDDAPAGTPTLHRAAGKPSLTALPDRRLFIAGGAAIAALAAGAGWWLWSPTRPAAPPVSPAVAALMTQGFFAMRQATPEGMAQGKGVFRHIVEIAPDYADGWGALALAYAFAAHQRPLVERVQLAEHTRAAAERALALDPRNGYARAAQALLLPKRGNWRRFEQALRYALSRNPDNDSLMMLLTTGLTATGRLREAVTVLERIAVLAQPSPAVAFLTIQALWATNRLEEADAASDKAIALYPQQFSVWFTRCYLLLYTGRAAQARSMLEAVDDRPSGIPAKNFDAVIAVAKAMEAPTPANIDVAVTTNIALAHVGAGFAENAMQFCSAFGRIDDAFAVAEAYYFDRGFSVASQRFSQQQNQYTVLADRATWMLFVPSTRAMRHDPRFEKLVSELGLTRYWAESGSVPDYRQGDDR